MASQYVKDAQRRALEYSRKKQVDNAIKKTLGQQAALAPMPAHGNSSKERPFIGRGAISATAGDYSQVYPEKDWELHGNPYHKVKPLRFDISTTPQGFTKIVDSQRPSDGTLHAPIYTNIFGAGDKSRAEQQAAALALATDAYALNNRHSGGYVESGGSRLYANGGERTKDWLAQHNVPTARTPVRLPFDDPRARAILGDLAPDRMTFTPAAEGPGYYRPATSVGGPAVNISGSDLNKLGAAMAESAYRNRGQTQGALDLPSALAAATGGRIPTSAEGFLVANNMARNLLRSQRIAQNQALKQQELNLNRSKNENEALLKLRQLAQQEKEAETKAPMWQAQGEYYNKLAEGVLTPEQKMKQAEEDRRAKYYLEMAKKIASLSSEEERAEAMQDLEASMRGYEPYFKDVVVDEAFWPFMDDETEQRKFYRKKGAALPVE